MIGGGWAIMNAVTTETKTTNSDSEETGDDSEEESLGDQVRVEV